jgi:3-keto-5-aminohexanoate cleavage enzyme
VSLPIIMVAPNGARKTKRDHPALPVSIDETVAATIASKAVGAHGWHAHVRDDEGRHVLDAGLYRELLAECEQKLPGFYTQITTEAVGIYSAREQDAMVRQVQPGAVSVAFSEMFGVNMSGDEKLARNFYHWASETGIDVQHIFYSGEELAGFGKSIQRGIIPNGNLQMLFVLGRYTQNQQSAPSDVLPYVTALNAVFADRENTRQIDWAVCAFGRRETECLMKSIELGGKVRVGFENNMINSDGSQAVDNAERVKEVVDAMKSLGVSR